MEHSSSPAKTINALDVYKTARGAGLFVGAYVATVLFESLVRDITSGALDLGQYAAFKGVLVPLLASLAELARRYRANHGGK